MSDKHALHSSALTRLVLTLAVALLGALALVPAGFAQAYPSPPFDFAHQASPHDQIYSFEGGLTDRLACGQPLLRSVSQRRGLLLHELLLWADHHAGRGNGGDGE